ISEAGSLTALAAQRLREIGESSINVVFLSTFSPSDISAHDGKLIVSVGCILGPSGSYYAGAFDPPSLVDILASYSTAPDELTLQAEDHGIACLDGVTQLETTDDKRHTHVMLESRGFSTITILSLRRGDFQSEKAARETIASFIVAHP